MTLRMLIDATHAEETRVVVVRGNRLEEFDFESSNKKQLKGNIYLAKVTRVEPSLQAAFVEYGGNRHGFLAFNEIHPDYYQIPVADRQALLAEEARHAADEAAAEDASDAASGSAEETEQPNGETGDAAEAAAGEDEAGEGSGTAALEASEPVARLSEEGDAADAGASEEQPPAVAETVASANPDALDEVPRPRARPRRSYKIQEVIKKRQILLVQVVKEERGNKGAALTTYLSLAGRYCVLMPNTARGGGISRKISNPAARKKLKAIVSELDVPEGMGVIVRTAGMNRTKSEIKRDFEYLLRVWDEVRETTLKSTAPTLVYEEASLIKRAIRDLYTKDIEEILVEGAEGYRSAKEFMRMMQPSHARKVQHYDDRIPLFHRFQIEQQLDSMHSNTVQLKSGGYIVINPTEALVAIDVNSGRSTREHNIEETALKTNLEASDEIARQLRLRDLAGLIVIDYIDMEDPRNNRAVERRLREALKADRARIQVGRISPFGLLEMSRQRLRPSLFEASMVPCSACHGSGYVRSTESTVLHVLRAIEDRGIRGTSAQITVHVPTAVALYILNQKREVLAGIERRYEMRVLIYGDDTLVPPDHRIVDDVTRPARKEPGDLRVLPAVDPTPVEPEEEEQEEAAEAGASAPTETREEEGRRRRRRRRRGRRREEDGDAALGATDVAEPRSEEQSDFAAAEQRNGDGLNGANGQEGEGRRGRRRRGRRGGRRRREGGAPMSEQPALAASESDHDGPEAFRVIEPEPGPFAPQPASSEPEPAFAASAAETEREPALTSFEAPAASREAEPAFAAPAAEAESDPEPAPPAPSEAQLPAPEPAFATGAETRLQPEPEPAFAAPAAETGREPAAPAPSEAQASSPEPAFATSTETRFEPEPDLSIPAPPPAGSEVSEPQAAAAEESPAATVEAPPAPDNLVRLEVERAPEPKPGPAPLAAQPEPSAAEAVENRPKRRGWWSRRE